LPIAAAVQIKLKTSLSPRLGRGTSRAESGMKKKQLEKEKKKKREKELFST